MAKWVGLYPAWLSGGNHRIARRQGTSVWAPVCGHQCACSRALVTQRLIHHLPIAHYTLTTAIQDSRLYLYLSVCDSTVQQNTLTECKQQISVSVSLCLYPSLPLSQLLQLGWADGPMLWCTGPSLIRFTMLPLTLQLGRWPAQSQRPQPMAHFAQLTAHFAQLTQAMNQTMD